MSMKILPLLNFDNAFAESPNAKVIPCDVRSFTSKKDVNDYTRYLFSDGNIGVGLNASCECGNLTGNYLLNTICPICKTEVKEPLSTDLEYNSWIEIPDFLPPLLQPSAFHILKTWAGTYQRQSLLLLLMTVGAELPSQIAEVYTPGLWSFYNNFDKLMEFLISEYKPLKEPDNTEKKTINTKSIYIREFLSKYRDCLFARYFPILNSSMHVKSSQGTMSYVDKSSEHIRKAIIELANIHYNYIESKNMPEIELNTLEMIKAYYQYSESIIVLKLQRKRGLIRRHMLGSKCHFTFRGVITPIIDAADADELYFPWTIGVQQHKLEILNILINRMGYSIHDAQMLYELSKYEYNEIVHDILNKLIEECPYKGIPVTLGRNPSLIFGAIQLFFVTKIKTDSSDHTISISPLCLKALNADFDGDAKIYGVYKFL